MRKFTTVATLATALCSFPVQATNEIEELYQWAGTKGGNFSFPDINLVGQVDIKSIPKETRTFAHAQNPCALGVLYLHGVMVGAYDPQRQIAFVKTIYSQDELLELKEQLKTLTPGSQISIVEFPECIYGTGDIYNRSKANNEADRKFTASVIHEIKQNDQVELKFFYTSTGGETTLMVDARDGQYSMPTLTLHEKSTDFPDSFTPEERWEYIMRERNGYYLPGGEGSSRGVMANGFDGPLS